MRCFSVGLVLGYMFVEPSDSKVTAGEASVEKREPMFYMSLFIVTYGRVHFFHFSFLLFLERHSW